MKDCNGQEVEVGDRVRFYDLCATSQKELFTSCGKVVEIRCHDSSGPYAIIWKDGKETSFIWKRYGSYLEFVS